MRKEKSSPAVGIAAPVKLTALCRKSNSHLFMPRACFGHIGTLFLSSLQLFFLLCSKFEYFTNTLFFFFFHWITHLLEVSAEQNRCTYSSSCTHGTTPAPRPSPPHLPTSPLHPPLASLHFTHLWGQLCAPLSSQRSHTHSAKPHSSLSAPASLMFLTVPQCPSVLPACNALGSCESRSLSSFSSLFLSAPHFGDTHIIYFMTEDSI